MGRTENDTTSHLCYVKIRNGHRLKSIYIHKWWQMAWSADQGSERRKIGGLETRRSGIEAYMEGLENGD